MLLPVAGLLVVLLAVLVVAGHLGVPLVVFVVRTAVVHLVVLLEMSPELAVFGASVVALWRRMRVPKRVQVQLVQWCAELELLVQS